ncbi:ESX secretion-associated protein EspG [Amycolatopsis sp. CA-230715]|uniref:ESX secretion-associated protein EspG n=1 Tax=Amycolatopsis sp. CA-230715 TaxID=2745196 RepID=UPI001C016A80|nr:ESX secretion-associated protein EspG [Amycolatopsis sp. CA-230715]
MRVLSRQVVLSQDSLDLAASWLNLGLPTTLEPEPMWRSDDEIRGREDRTRAELADNGLLDRGDLDEDFAETLLVLCRAAQEYFSYVQSHDEEYRLHVAVSGQNAVFACNVPNTGRVLLRAARPEAPVEDLVVELPDWGAGHGASLSVPEADLRAAMGGGRASDEARRMLALFDLPRTGGGQLSAAVRDGLGSHRKSRRDVCTYLDTERGRWLFSFSGEGEDRYVNAAPARYETVVAKGYELRDRLLDPR